MYGAQALWLALTKAEKRAGVPHRPFRAVHGFRRGVAGDVARGSGDAWLGVQYIGDRDPDRIAEYVQEREDALEGAVAMLDRAWAVPTPEREPETVTKPSPAPEGENGASESDWGAESWEAPEAGLEPATRSLSEPGAPTADRAPEAKTGAESPPVERPTSKESRPKPSPKPSPRKRRA